MTSLDLSFSQNQIITINKFFFVKKKKKNKTVFAFMNLLVIIVLSVHMNAATDMRTSSYYEINLAPFRDPKSFSGTHNDLKFAI